VEDIVVLAWLELTYEVCKLSLSTWLSLTWFQILYTNSFASSAPCAPRRRITKVGSTTETHRVHRPSKWRARYHPLIFDFFLTISLTVS
jgi:hypothetical protein